MFGIPESTSTEVVRMLASRSVPIPTTARWKSGTPSWRSASGSVVSATAAWVRSSAKLCTTRWVDVDAEHLGAAADQFERQRRAEPAEAEHHDPARPACGFRD